MSKPLVLFLLHRQKSILLCFLVGLNCRQAHSHAVDSLNGALPFGTGLVKCRRSHEGLCQRSEPPVRLPQECSWRVARWSTRRKRYIQNQGCIIIQHRLHQPLHLKSLPFKQDCHLPDCSAQACKLHVSLACGLRWGCQLCTEILTEQAFSAGLLLFSCASH